MSGGGFPFALHVKVSVDPVLTSRTPFSGKVCEISGSFNSSSGGRSLSENKNIN